MWTVQDAKAKFSAVVEAALAGEPQHVTRRGEPAVVIVSEEDWAALNELKKPVMFGDIMGDIPQAPDDEPDFDFKRLGNARPRDIDF
ncbi:prevent-host-death family protein [Jannaschia faecimaris]|uniref:Antitoxin n=1 Tax=Jannaschia faecimaris TaxID=1244108 RepID=A0A1H3TBA2_9RHOB|nr:type II toxin-antitoxin system Phd/YefM family antitoxin [Jannaschia faecimaris]SDZ47583.1 prevent-host-death family protein [Jannaschia faecimaris]